MLTDLKTTSIRRKSLLDPQTILLLKSQEESVPVPCGHAVLNSLDVDQKVNFVEVGLDLIPSQHLVIGLVDGRVYHLALTLFSVGQDNVILLS